MNAKGDWTCTFYTGDDGSRSVDNQGGDLCNRGARICSVDQGKLPTDYVFGDQKPEKYKGIPTSLLVYQPPEEPADRLLDTVSPECDEICLAATGATALSFGGLTATACPAGTAASAGSAAVAACWGLGVFSVGATTSVYEKTKSRAEQGEVDGSAVLCSMAAGGAVPPGTDLSALVRPIAGRVLKGLSC